MIADIRQRGQYRQGQDFEINWIAPEVEENWKDVGVYKPTGATTYWAVESIIPSDTESVVIVEVQDVDGVPLSGIDVAFLVDSPAADLGYPDWGHTVALPRDATNGRVITTVGGIATWSFGAEYVYIRQDDIPSTLVTGAYWVGLPNVKNAKEHHTLHIRFRLKVAPLTRGANAS